MQCVSSKTSISAQNRLECWFHVKALQRAVEFHLRTSQLKPPPFGSHGRVGDLTLTLVKRHQYPYPEARVQIKHPYPWGNKDKNIKVSRKKDKYLNRELFQLYMYKYAALILSLCWMSWMETLINSPQSLSYFWEIRHASLSRLKHSLTVTSTSLLGQSSSTFRLSSYWNET